VAGSAKYDAVVVGSGPNGLTAAVVLARAGFSVLVLEAHERIGGGCRTAELTLPGFKHDVCSAIHPMGVLSPIFREIGLENFVVEWVHPPEPLAHPLPDGRAALLSKSLQRTAQSLGIDAASWEGLFGPLLERAEHSFRGDIRPGSYPEPSRVDDAVWNDGATFV
jgi:phytoene dehydrogenase-like protein